MTEPEIQRATTTELERRLREIGPFPQGVGPQTVGILIAKELRYRARFGRRDKSNVTALRLSCRLER